MTNKWRQKRNYPHRRGASKETVDREAQSNSSLDRTRTIAFIDGFTTTWAMVSYHKQKKCFFHESGNKVKYQDSAHLCQMSIFDLIFNFDSSFLRAEKMSHMGNAFVACGVIYCIDEYNSKTTTINFAYDTKTGKQWIPNIQFTNQYGFNSMVDYNPRERVLYAWDYRRLVTYPLTFEEQ